eukprot:gene10749-3369_t
MCSPLTVVIDIGSHSTKCGFGGSNIPEYIFPSIYSFDPKEELFYVGHEAEKQSFETHRFLSSTGKIKTEEAYEGLLNEIFHQKLNTYPAEYGQSVLLTCKPFETKKQKKFIFETMFETFSTNLFKLENEFLMSLYESGRTSGVVLEVGDGCSYSVGIENGNVNLETFQKFDFSGTSCSYYLYTLLSYIPNFRDKYSLTESDLDFIKSNFCYIAEDYALENEKMENIDIHQQCILPDGQKINLNSERFCVGESFFQPIITNNLDFTETDGIQYTISNTLKLMDFEKMKNSIVLSGGSCNFKGFQNRLEIEISSLFKENMKVVQSIHQSLTLKMTFV